MNKIALAPTSLPSTGPVEYIESASKAGWKTVGMRFFRAPGLRYPFPEVCGDATRMRDTENALKNSGLELLEVLSYYLQPTMDWDSFMPSLEFAAKLGAKYILLIGDDPEWNRMVDSYGKFCDTVGKLNNMVAAIEAPVHRRVLCNIPLTAQLIFDAKRKNSAICLDPSHFTEVGHKPADLKGMDPALFPYSQINDGHIVNRLGQSHWHGEPNGSRIDELGDGQVPLFDILDALPADIPLSLEWPQRGGDKTPVQWATHARESTQRLLDRYFAQKKK